MLIMLVGDAKNEHAYDGSSPKVSRCDALLLNFYLQTMKTSGRDVTWSGYSGTVNWQL